MSEEPEQRHVRQLSDGDLAEGIVHYQAALAAHAPDAPIQADIADLLRLYEQELAERQPVDRANSRPRELP